MHLCIPYGQSSGLLNLIVRIPDGKNPTARMGDGVFGDPPEFVCFFI
jgi:hypothetical protein